MKNLYISVAEYDYHTLLKVAEMAGLAGIVGFHEAGDGYLVSFPDGENTDTLINDYKSRLKDLKTTSGCTDRLFWRDSAAFGRKIDRNCAITVVY